MASSRNSALGKLVSAGIKYGPLAYEGLRRGKGPAQEMAQQFAQKQMSRRNARTIAMEHAAHLVDGSVLPVYDGDQRVWVVFSGDLPVGTHPVVTTPLADLLSHYDLGKRITPGVSPRRAKRRTVRGTAEAEPTGTGWPAAGSDRASGPSAPPEPPPA